MWKKVSELREPFNDAVNYSTRSEKEFFNKLFLRTDEVQKCLSPSVYFVIGDKGAGKTAYPTYIENNSTDEVRAKIVTLTETQYKRFVELKRAGKLTYSDYGNIWRFIILVVVSQVLVGKSKGFFAGLTGKFKKVETALSKWNRKALNPEIDVAFEALRDGRASASLGRKGVLEFDLGENSSRAEKATGISHNLFEAETSIKEAISDLKLSNDHVIFIDGIDFRPAAIGYRDYLDCIKGLGEAVWQLNIEYFKNIRDSKGRIKVVLLIRPDVFHSLNLYNSNSRIQDNCVFLDWSTTDNQLADSKLFEACGKFFSSQQNPMPTPAEAWSNYFPNGESFRRLLRFSFQKPRDLLTFIRILRNIQLKRGSGDLTVFDETLIGDPDFTKEIADYLLGEVRNYAAFYMTPEDFAAYLKFFQYLDGKSKFDMSTFTKAFDHFSSWFKGEDVKARNFARDPESLLQLFYDVNVIGYKELTADSAETFYHWSFRERSLNNIAPKVKSVGSLVVNSGIAKALDIGKSVVVESAPPTGTSMPPTARRNRRHGRGRPNS